MAEPDFDDEDSVRAVMARELDIAPEDLELDDGGRGFSSFGVDSFWLVESGRMGWVVARDNDVVRDLALAVVKQDIENEPEIFSQDFLESHINVDRLRRDLEPDLLNENHDYFDEMSDDDLLDDGPRYGIDTDQYMETDEDDEDAEPELTDRDGLVEALAEEKTSRDLKDPVDYLVEIYGRDQAIAEAIKIAGIDIDAAAEDAVNTDGPEHFVAPYDGNSHELDCGWVYWRTD